MESDTQTRARSALGGGNSIDADAVPSAWDARTRGVARASAKG